MLCRSEPLSAFARDILQGLGASPDVSSIVATSLIKADLRGIGTHGIGILPLNAEMIAGNAIDPHAQPTFEYASECAIKVDGRSAFGQLTGRKAIEVGVEAAARYGVAAIGIRNGSHLGRLGEWAELATARGMAFMALANAGGGARNVAPFGGHERKLSTNPVAFGIPTFAALPFDVIVDFATSQVSGSDVRAHYQAGDPLNREWTTTASGDAVSDATAFMEGVGALLPLGGRATGHKGYGLSVVAELLGGIAGGMVVGEHDPEWFSNAAMFILLDPSKFLRTDELERRITAVADHLRDDDVRLPGEGAYQRDLKAREQGVDIPEQVLVSLRKLAISVNVEIPAYLDDAALDPIDDHDTLKTW